MCCLDGCIRNGCLVALSASLDQSSAPGVEAAWAHRIRAMEIAPTRVLKGLEAILRQGWGNLRTLKSYSFAAANDALGLAAAQQYRHQATAVMIGQQTGKSV